MREKQGMHKTGTQEYRNPSRWAERQTVAGGLDVGYLLLALPPILLVKITVVQFLLLIFLESVFLHLFVSICYISGMCVDTCAAGAEYPLVPFCL